MSCHRFKRVGKEPLRVSTRSVQVNRDRVRVLLQILLGIAALLLIFLLLLGNRWRVDGPAAGTQTAIALMTGVLLGPSPTSTAPTPTPSDLPTMTSTIPTATPSATRTPTETAVPFASAAPRTREPRPTEISTLTPVVPTTGPTSINTPVQPTLTPIRPTDTAVAPPTDTQPAPPTPILTILPTIQLP
jgi:hypothetical protein